jgi:hypothetical protein
MLDPSPTPSKGPLLALLDLLPLGETEPTRRWYRSRRAAIYHRHHPALPFPAASTPKLVLVLFSQVIGAALSNLLPLRPIVNEVCFHWIYKKKMSEWNEFGVLVPTRAEVGGMVLYVVTVRRAYLPSFSPSHYPSPTS